MNSFLSNFQEQFFGGQILQKGQHVKVLLAHSTQNEAAHCVRTAEDHYVRLFTGGNRWAEREENRRAQKLTSHDRQHGPDMDEDEF